MKSRRTFGAHKPKAPSGRELTPKAVEGLFYDEIFVFTIPPACFASHLPLHKGGSFPPDSKTIRCNTLYLAWQACKKEYKRTVRTPFAFSASQNLLYGRHPFLFFLHFFKDVNTVRFNFHFAGIVYFSCENILHRCIKNNCTV